MKAKDITVMHQKKGPVKLGSLSFNEICRTLYQSMLEQSLIKQELQLLFATYGNHLASMDILTKQEWSEIHG
jgi:hypothetical protein